MITLNFINFRLNLHMFNIIFSIIFKLSFINFKALSIVFCWIKGSLMVIDLIIKLVIIHHLRFNMFYIFIEKAFLCIQDRIIFFNVTSVFFRQILLLIKRMLLSSLERFKRRLFSYILILFMRQRIALKLHFITKNIYFLIKENRIYFLAIKMEKFIILYHIIKSVIDQDQVYKTNNLNYFQIESQKMSDFSLTTFASKGKLPQIENALAAVAKGQTSLGIKAKNGVVIATQKKLSSTLMDESSYTKTQIITQHIGAVYSGLGPDFRLLAQKARKLVQTYFVKYFEPMAVQTLCRQTSELVQQKTQAGGYRPFGVSVLVAGYDEDGPHLTQIDPSGAFYNWKATAVGKNAKNAKVFLQKRYKADMQIEDAIHTALMTLKEGFQGQMDNTNIEVGVIRQDKKFQVLTPAQIKEYLDELQ